MLRVVERYTAKRPGNALQEFLPALRAVNGSDSHEGLGEAFTDAWAEAAKDAAFRSAQDAERDSAYFDPAVERAEGDGLSALGQFIYYDAYVMHGYADAEGTVGFRTIRAQALAEADPPSEGGDEEAYLNAFLDARVAAMRKEPSHSDTSRVETAQRASYAREGSSWRPRWRGRSTARASASTGADPEAGSPANRVPGGYRTLRSLIGKLPNRTSERRTPLGGPVHHPHTSTSRRTTRFTRLTRTAGLAALALGLAFTAIPATTAHAGAPTRPAAHLEAAATGLDDPAKKDIAMQLVSSAENSSLDWKGAVRLHRGHRRRPRLHRRHHRLLLRHRATCSSSWSCTPSASPATCSPPYLPALRAVDGTDSHEGLDPGFTGDWAEGRGGPRVPAGAARRAGPGVLRPGGARRARPTASARSASSPTTTPS